MQRISYFKTIGLALVSLFLVVSIIMFPKQAFDASVKGLSIWWEVVFPAQLPFFITAELLMGFGVVHFVGILLEPLMRPLFRVPGVGGFVMSMGLASGYPMGAKITVRLREQELISRTEGERLVCITSTSGPLFMIGAVAVGFFHDASLGIIIAAAHYISAICVGLIMRFHGNKNMDRSINLHDLMASNNGSVSKSILLRALQGMHRARIQDGRPMGTLMGDAVKSSLQTLFMIGGFIIMFSVLINILSIVGIRQLLTALLSVFLFPLGMNTELIAAISAGLFEITLGAQLASEAAGNPLVYQVAVAGAIIAWSGLSVHAQVASMLADTDIRYYPYIVARMLHSFLVFLWTFILWNPIQRFIGTVTPTFRPAFAADVVQRWDGYAYFSYSLLFLFILLSVLCLFVFLAQYMAKRKKAALDR